LTAIEKRQEVTLTKRGKAIARIVPLCTDAAKSVHSQAAFGMWSDVSAQSVDQQVRKLREGRFHDL
jgi:antitoxin (DNA-binding transcriptional repressor) of toxin-antitoxin stability system